MENFIIWFAISDLRFNTKSKSFEISDFIVKTFWRVRRHVITKEERSRRKHEFISTMVTAVGVNIGVINSAAI